MSDLRTRIAKAIREAAAQQTYWVPGPILSGVYADAVIRELGLRRVTGHGPYSSHSWYVTDWVIDE